MNREEIEYIKHCGEHFEFLTGGRGHSKTKQIIEQLQQENRQLEEKYEKLQEAFKKAITTEHHKIHALLDIIDETKTAVDYMIGNVDISEIHGTKLKQILDKTGDNNV